MPSVSFRQQAVCKWSQRILLVRWNECSALRYRKAAEFMINKSKFVNWPMSIWWMNDKWAAVIIQIFATKCDGRRGYATQHTCACRKTLLMYQASYSVCAIKHAYIASTFPVLISNSAWFRISIVASSVFKGAADFLTVLQFRRVAHVAMGHRSAWLAPSVTATMVNCQCEWLSGTLKLIRSETVVASARCQPRFLPIRQRR